MVTSEVKITRKWHSAQERSEIINRWKESGKSKQEFCNEYGIKYHTLMKWLTRSRKHKFHRSNPGQPDHGFSLVKLVSGPTGSLFARICVGKLSVDLFQPVSPEYLLRFLKSWFCPLAIATGILCIPAPVICVKVTTDWADWYAMNLKKIRFVVMCLFFYRAHATKIKLLHWQADGFCIYSKRLEKGTFEIPKEITISIDIEITSQQLQFILEGIVLSSVKKRSRYKHHFVDK